MKNDQRRLDLLTHLCGNVQILNTNIQKQCLQTIAVQTQIYLYFVYNKIFFRYLFKQTVDMVPEKRKRSSTKKLEYNHTMKFSKTKKWRDSVVKKEDNKDRKREERLKKKTKLSNKK